MDLFDFALIKDDTAEIKIPDRSFRNVGLQTLCTEKSRNAQLQCKKLTTALTSPGLTVAVADLCVTVNLCKPNQYSTHMVKIYNGDTRSHSNSCEDADADISCVSDRTDLPPWRPRAPSDVTPDAADFVVIRNTSSERKWCIEGVAV